MRNSNKFEEILFSLIPQILVIAESEEENPDALIQLGVTRNKIMTAQYECYQKIMQDPVQQTEGKHDEF